MALKYCRKFKNKTIKYRYRNRYFRHKSQQFHLARNDFVLFAGCATSVLVTSAGMGEMVMQVLVGSVSLMKKFV